MDRKIYITLLVLISTLICSLYGYHMNTNMGLLAPGHILHLNNFSGSEIFNVQTAGDSLSFEIFEFLELAQQENNTDLTFKFTNRGIRGAILETYQHPIHTGVNITILWIGSNNIRSMDSHEISLKILDAMRSYEKQGMICFVIGMPARYGPRAGNPENQYLAEAKYINQILEKNLRHSGKFISLPTEAYGREAYRSDQTHFTPEMYKTIAKLLISTMEEFIKTNSASRL